MTSKRPPSALPGDNRRPVAGDGQRGSSSPPRGPLAGVKVIDLSWHLAGPFCTLILADLGATVIKVEAPGSHGGYDPGGFIRHYYKGQDAHYMALNRNKKSITLNLKSDEGKALFTRLCTTADVVFNNFRAGVMQRLGLGYEQLSKVNADLIFVSLSSFGQDGPYVRRPGVDLVVQALSGAMSMTGEPGRPPARIGIPIGDLAGGMWAAIGILGALRARQTGIARGCELDVALLDGQIAMTPESSGRYFRDGTVPGPQGSRAHGRLQGAFRCADDRYIVIDHMDRIPWSEVCTALELGELVEDPRGATPASRAEHAEELMAIVRDKIQTRSSTAWDERLRPLGLPYARVNRLDEVLADEHARARDMVVGITHSLGDRLNFVGNPIKISGYRTVYDSPPLIGEHTDSVLRELGVSEQDLSTLGQGV